MLIDSLRLNLPFGPDMGIFGLIVGASAGAISGGALLSMLSGLAEGREQMEDGRG